jgi:sugar/nucleoside kinase (ribokinase family)
MDNQKSNLPTSQKIEPVDYLVIGHITQDVVPGGFTLGGTVSYASLTALALAKRVGIVTSCAPELQLPEFKDIQVVKYPSAQTTTFENIQKPDHRIQIIHHQADRITAKQIPELWRNTPIIHIGPVDNEIDTDVLSIFPNSFIGVTPQGFMRKWDETGHVKQGHWKDAEKILPLISAAVLSVEDVKSDEKVIESYVAHSQVLVVTEGARGARLYWNGDMRYFVPPHEVEVDPTGAGDIFAAAFFIRYQKTRDPWEAARFATVLAAQSVNRKGLAGIPTSEEVQTAEAELLMEVRRS